MRVRRMFVLSVMVVASSCTGALSGGTFNVGQEDNRIAGAKLYDQHCGGCHDPKAGQLWHAPKKIPPRIPNVIAPDLLSSAWRDSLLGTPYGEPPSTAGDADRREWLAQLMAVKISWVCRNTQQRWPNGDRVVYQIVGHTLDGLTIDSIEPHGSDFPVVVMPLCNLEPNEYRAIANWITCSQYRGTSACKRTP